MPPSPLYCVILISGIVSHTVGTTQNGPEHECKRVVADLTEHSGSRFKEHFGRRVVYPPGFRVRAIETTFRRFAGGVLALGRFAIANDYQVRN